MVNSQTIAITPDMRNSNHNKNNRPIASRSREMLYSLPEIDGQVVSFLFSNRDRYTEQLELLPEEARSLSRFFLACFGLFFYHRGRLCQAISLLRSIRG
jgi:hypothetical protein